MKKKFLSVTLLIALTVSLTSCGNSYEEANATIENTATSSTSQVASVESSTNEPTPTIAPTKEPEVVATPTPIPTQTPHVHNYVEEVLNAPSCNSVGITKYTCECGDSYEKSHNFLPHELKEWVYNNDATYEANGTECAICKNCNEIYEIREKEGTKLVAPIPSDLDTNVGSELAFEGSVIAPNGVELQKLKEFNKAGLYYASEEFDFNYDWSGYFNNDDPNDDQSITQTWGDNMGYMQEAIYGTRVREEQGQGFSVWNRYITFHYVGSAAAGEFELHRHPEEGYYTISINFDASKNVGGHGVENHRSILLTLCTFISSTPSELEDALYNDAFVEEFFTNEAYTKIGDCQVKFLSDGNGIHYAIAPLD